MPFTSAQLATGAHYTLQTHERNEPIDQVNVKHVTLDWLMRHKTPSTFGNGYHTENVYIGNDSNYQNYFGADQVTYNERDPVRQAEYAWYNAHDGFWFDEDRLRANGIELSDDGEATPTRVEVDRLADLLEQSYRALRLGFQQGLAHEVLLDGSQSSKAVPGLDHIVGTSPADDTVGGLDASSYTFWRNNANLAIAQADLPAEMQESWDAVVRYGGKMPTFIPAGLAFINAYRAQAGETINRQIVVREKGGTGMDLAVTDVFFRGIPIIHDPTFEELDADLGAITYPWTKRAYFLNDALKFRPVKGHWMRDRKPERLPDRYVHYFAKTASYGMTTAQRNALAVLSVA